MRQALALRLRQITQVSIHASVKDATGALLASTGPNSFNPRICKRCDQGAAYAKTLAETFQSTHL